MKTIDLDVEAQILLRETRKIVEGLGRTLAPFCEVVLHDLRTPEKSILAIECPLSGRQVGDSTTEMGLARIADPAFPEIIQNYPNRFPDGRPAKSTSIGLRDSAGNYIAALCINMDVSMLSSVQHVLTQIMSTQGNDPPVVESLRTRSIDELRETIDRYAAARNVPPKALKTDKRRELVRYLATTGLLQVSGAAQAAARHLGVSRGSIYNDLKVSG